MPTTSLGWHGEPKGKNYWALNVVDEKREAWNHGETLEFPARVQKEGWKRWKRCPSLNRYRAARYHTQLRLPPHIIHV